MLLFGFPWCDKRVATDVGSTYRTPLQDVVRDCWNDPQARMGTRVIRRALTCNDVTETYERPDGLRYQKQHRDCVPHYELRGPCR